MHVSEQFVRPRPRFAALGGVLRLALFCLGGGSLTGAQPPPPRAPDAAVVALALNPQSSARYQCGPTTLASVLAFLGRPVPEATIAAAIYSPTAHGVLLTDLAWYAREAGFSTEIHTGSLADLQTAVAAGLPPIVLLDVGRLGTQQPHFTAITASTAVEVRYLSPQSAGKAVSRAKFLRQWQRAGSQYLLLTPSS